MEPRRYFDDVELMEPHCKGCQHVIHYEKDTEFDNKKKILMCRFCGSAI